MGEKAAAQQKAKHFGREELRCFNTLNKGENNPRPAGVDLLGGWAGRGHFRVWNPAPAPSPALSPAPDPVVPG